MSSVQLFAVLGLVLSLPAAACLTDRAVGRRSRPVFLLFGTLVYACLLLLPVHVEATLELLGVVDRMRLAGPATVAALVMVWWATSRARAGGGREQVPAGFPSGSTRVPGDIAAALAALALVYAFFALERSLGRPVTWDSVWYHLPVAASWLQSGSLGITPDAHFYEAVTWNGDVLGLLALATGWPALGELWNVLSLSLVLTGSYLLGRLVGLGRDGGLLAVVLVACLPMVLYLTFSAYVDLLVAGGLIGSLTLLLLISERAPEDGSVAGLLLGAGLACGLAVGTKPTAWPFAVLLTAGGAVLIARLPRAPSARIRLAACFVAGVAAPCLFWFLRNVVTTGNPFYPVGISVFGREIFTGDVPGAITFDRSAVSLFAEMRYWLTVPWTDQSGTGTGYPYSPGSGLGPVFAAFVVPGIAYLGWQVRPWRRPAARGERRWRLRAGLMVLLLLVSALWWFVLTPVWRYGLGGLVLACVLAGPFAEDVRDAVPRLFRPVFLASVLIFGLVAAIPRLQSLAHQIRHGEWSWDEYYHVPAVYARLPKGARVVSVDVTTEGWNNLELLGPDLSRRLVPDWKARALLERGDVPWGCGWYVVDRAPFRRDVRREIGSVDASPVLVGEAPAMHGKERWRLWFVDGRGCDAPEAEVRP